MADATMQQIEAIITALRQEVGELRSDARTAAALAASAQTQITAHIAVCDERQRASLMRQVERDRWHDGQAETFKRFMTDSADDRARIRESILKTAAAAREDQRLWAIRFLTCVAGANILAGVGIVFTLLKLGATH